jgi:hypothetical protein
VSHLLAGVRRYITPAAAISFMFYEQFKALLKMYTTGDRTNHNNFIFKHPAVPLIAGTCPPSLPPPISPSAGGATSVDVPLQSAVRLRRHPHDGARAHWSADCVC